MKNISSGLRAALDAGEICYLYKIVAKDGTARLFTDHNNSLVVGGETYVPSAGVGRIKMKTTNNAEVSNQEVAATILDMPEVELQGGKWDSSKIEVSIASWRDPGAGKMIVFKGELGVIQWTDEGFRADIQNYLRNLGRNIGETVTANCRHELFGSPGPGKMGACGLNKASYTSSGSITRILSQRLKFKISNTGRPDNWASAGYIRFTSGIHNGLTYEVKIHRVEGGSLGESVELYIPTLSNLTEGTTFELSAGCDKTFETCKTKFGNQVNFGGFPHLQVDVNARIETL